MLVTPVNDTFVAPVVGVPDVDVVDAGYSGDGIGAYHLEIPVFANDLDPNGPDPADPASGVRIPAINGIQGVDASAAPPPDSTSARWCSPRPTGSRG